MIWSVSAPESMAVKKAQKSISEAKAEASAYNKALMASDPRFRGAVLVRSLNDATTLFFADAFALRWHHFYFVFTEHYGLHVHHEDDVRVICFAKSAPIRRLA